MAFPLKRKVRRMANENQHLTPPQVIHALMTIIREKREQFGTKLKIKQKSPIMRLLGAILFFNRGFMDSFITVLGKTIYFPSNWETIIQICEDHLERGADDSEFPITHTPEARRLFAVLCHEYVHQKDSGVCYSWTHRIDCFLLGLSMDHALALPHLWDPHTILLEILFRGKRLCNQHCIKNPSIWNTTEFYK